MRRHYESSKYITLKLKKKKKKQVEGAGEMAQQLRAWTDQAQFPVP